MTKASGRTTLSDEHPPHMFAIVTVHVVEVTRYQFTVTILSLAPPSSILSPCAIDSLVSANSSEHESLQGIPDFVRFTVLDRGGTPLVLVVNSDLGGWPDKHLEEERASMMMAIQSAFNWFIGHPLGTATALYAAGVLGVLVYAYFEPRGQT